VTLEVRVIPLPEVEPENAPMRCWFVIDVRVRYVSLLESMPMAPTRCPM
jgi:hypothetical protein